MKGSKKGTMCLEEEGSGVSDAAGRSRKVRTQDRILIYMV